MGKDTQIEWADDSANLWWGCHATNNPGCDHCYAADLDKRYGGDHWQSDERREIKGVWKMLDKAQRKAENENRYRYIFVGSMMDIFEAPKKIEGNSALDTGVLRDRLFERISDHWYDNIVFMLLTKRPGAIDQYIPKGWEGNPPRNVWFGTSVSNQRTIDQNVPLLYEHSPAASLRFLSVEPLIKHVSLDTYLEPVSIQKNSPYYIWLDGRPMIDWVIVGGESGHAARPMALQWVRAIRDDCQNNKVPFFFKQWGEWKQIHPGDSAQYSQVTCIEDQGNEYHFAKVGKKLAGRGLDGYIWHQRPKLKITQV